MRLRKTERIDQDRPRPADLADDARHANGFRTVSACARFLLAEDLSVDARETFDKTPDVVTAPLFAVRHDVDARVFLIGDREAYSVVLSFG